MTYDPSCGQLSNKPDPLANGVACAAPIDLCPHCGPKHGRATKMPPFVIQRGTLCIVQVICPVCSMTGPGLACFDPYERRPDIVAAIIDQWNALPRAP